MKIVQYDKDKFELTENEFWEAMEAWKIKSNYYCVRLGCSLSPFYKYVKTKEKVFFHFRRVIIDGKEDLVKVKYIADDDGRYFQVSGGDMMLVSISEEIKKNMIDEDEYINRKIKDNLLIK